MQNLRSGVLKSFVEILQLASPRHKSSEVKRKFEVNFNTKHLCKGDPLPPYNGKLRVYNSRYCPFAQRTLLALLAKDLDFEVININLVSKPEWLAIKNPLEKVPVLEIKENVCLRESLITVEYLDEVYPQRPLLPKDPVQKAHDKYVIEFCSQIGTLFIKMAKKPESINDENYVNFVKALNLVEEELKLRDSKFLHGEEAGYVDYMIWPWLERLMNLQGVDKRMEFDTNKYQGLMAYIETMLNDPAVAEYLVPKQVQLQIMESYKPGKTPNFDLLLDPRQ